MMITLLLASFHLILKTPQADLQPPIVYAGHSAEVTSLAFSPDGNRIYSTGLKEDRIWSVKTGETLGGITNSRGHSVAISPDGKLLAIAGFKSTSLYDVSNLNRIWTVEVDRSRYSLPFMLCVAFSPDGKTLATSGSSSKAGGRHGLKAGIVTILDAVTGEEIQTFEGLSTAAESVAFSPDGKLLAVGTEGAGGELPETGELIIWVVKTGQIRHRLKHVAEIKAGQNRCSASGVAFHPAGLEIAIASSDGTVRVWDLKTETIRLTLTGHEKPVRRVAYSPGGKHLASAGMDRSVRIWNTQDGKFLKSHSIDCPKVNAVVFSPDGGRLAVGGGEFLKSGIIHVWDLLND